MDAVEFLKEAIRMCEFYTDCTGCVLKQENVVMPCTCLTVSMETKAPDKLVAIIEKWAKEHPKKTRQSEFLKMFPNAKMMGGVLGIRPCDVDSEVECPDREERCTRCYEKYWLAEVE